MAKIAKDFKQDIEPLEVTNACDMVNIIRRGYKSLFNLLKRQNEVPINNMLPNLEHVKILKVPATKEF